MMNAFLLVVASALPPAIQQPNELTVFAAASLKESFQTLSRQYEKSHPGMKVRLQFAGSQQLASQINQGAPVDVFASAAPKNLDQVAYDPQTRRIFALNRLVIVTPPGEASPRTLRELARARRIVLAHPMVPVGGYALKALESASHKLGSAWLSSVKSHVVSQEQDVRAVLAKVELGEADAGIVYASDAVSARNKVRSSAIPAEYQPSIVYPIAVLKSCKVPHPAMDFIHLVLSPQGQRVLESQGFSSPLRHLNSLQLVLGGRLAQVRLPLPSSHDQTVNALGPDKKLHRYTGYPLSVLLGSKNYGSVIVEAADGYSQTFSLNDLKKAGAVLQYTPEGALQLIVLGQKPRVWVKWITRIEAK